MGCLCDAQDGFRRGRSTLRPVTRLQNFLARVDKTHILSVDIRRAFDMAEPRLATSYLSRIGIPDAVSSFFVSQLDGSQTYVWSAYGWTDRVQVRRGTRQGGVESPLLFLLLVDPILHILERELQYDFVTTPVPTPGDPELITKVEVSSGVEFLEAAGHCVLANQDRECFPVWKVDWDPFKTGVQGAGAIIVNDGQERVEVGPESAPVILGQLKSLSSKTGVTCSIQEAVALRRPAGGARERPGFLGGYADDLLIGHKCDAFLRRLIKELSSFYATIGCEISFKKSWWMTVCKCRRNCACQGPPDTGGLKAVPKGGFITYLGFRIYDNGRFAAGRDLLQTFHDAVVLLPGSNMSSTWAARFVCGILGGWMFYYGGLAEIGRHPRPFIKMLIEFLARNLT
eukprot:gene12711-biopygen9477